MMPVAAKIVEVAIRYGVRVLYGDVPREYAGPSSEPVGCDPKRRRVFVDSPEYIGESPEWVIHELAHVIAQPPWWHIDMVPEDLLLLQFERALTRCCIPGAYAAVLSLQEETQAELSPYGSDLASTPNYRRQWFWRRGFALCRTLGLLNRHNRPTFQFPQWRALRGQRSELHREIF